MTSAARWRAGRSRVVVLGGMALAVTAIAPLPVGAQAENPIVSAALSPDTIRVGEIFTLELHVALPSTGEVRFPAVLPLPESIEQRDAVQIDSHRGQSEWTARYALASWSTDSLAIPAVVATVAAEGAEEFEISIMAPRAAVASVLPADGSDLALRDARPFLRVRGFPWWLLLILAAGVAVAWWLWRRRQPQMVFVPTGPGDRALHDLEKLRTAWSGGSISDGQFYDRYEATLRRYARATRRWAPYRPLSGIVSAGDLFVALRRSLFVRFAHVRAHEGGPEAALDAGEAFVRSEMAPEPAETAPTHGPQPVAPRPGGAGGSKGEVVS